MDIYERALKVVQKWRTVNCVTNAESEAVIQSLKSLITDALRELEAEINCTDVVRQDALMKYDPVDGSENPYPSSAKQYRSYHGKVAWLHNPWTGEKRNPLDIGSDVFGLLISNSRD